MARQRELSPERKTFINSLLEHYKPTATQDVQETLKAIYDISMYFKKHIRMNR